jgi:hypothetical protein
MKITYLLISILSLGICFYYLSSCGSKTNKESNSHADTTKAIQTKENSFEDLRNMAFTPTPDQLGLSLPTDKDIVYGVIMDWEMGGATATVVSYLSGDASLYLSSGGGVIGGGQHPNVNSEAKKFVQLAQDYLSKASKTEETTLPETDAVKFYFITNKGKYVCQENISNFENNTSELLPLFQEGNKVLSELRIVSENK